VKLYGHPQRHTAVLTTHLPKPGDGQRVHCLSKTNWLVSGGVCASRVGFDSRSGSRLVVAVPGSDLVSDPTRAFRTARAVVCRSP
jgi:hypothetical protein